MKALTFSTRRLTETPRHEDGISYVVSGFSRTPRVRPITSDLQVRLTAAAPPAS
jgi:hypothetical protein